MEETDSKKLSAKQHCNTRSKLEDELKESDRLENYEKSAKLRDKIASLS